LIESPGVIGLGASLTPYAIVHISLVTQ